MKAQSGEMGMGWAVPEGPWWGSACRCQKALGGAALLTQGRPGVWPAEGRLSWPWHGGKRGHTGALGASCHTQSCGQP